MSIHSDIMASSAQVLVAIQGDTGDATVLYTPKGRAAFRWEGSNCDNQHGGLRQEDDGSFLKVTRVLATGPTAVLVAGGVTELEREAVLTALGHDDWSIDLAESHFGPEFVRLALYRRPVSRRVDHTQPAR